MLHPVIPWIGSKRRLANKIIPQIPTHTCYVEPFCGAAAIFFLKEQSKVEVINDINSDLITLYRVLQHHLEEFIRQFKWSLTSRQIYQWMKQTPPEVLTDIQRAARFYYLQKLSFGGKVDGRVFGTAASSPPRLNLLRIEEDLSQAHIRLSRTTIEHLSWEACIHKYDRDYTFFYCDPPYYGAEGYGVAFGLEQYIKMADIAKSIKGKMMISVNDIPEMRETFRELSMESVSIAYTVGKGRSESRELIIKNW